jgi:hypothetical protein
MGRGDLTNAEWARLAPLLPAGSKRGGRWNDHRTVINGVLYRARTGVPWRDLPERYGCWVTVYKGRRHWSADGTWERLLAAMESLDAGGLETSPLGIRQADFPARRRRVPKGSSVDGRAPGGAVGREAE